jgi:hypothetical protein
MTGFIKLNLYAVNAEDPTICYEATVRASAVILVATAANEATRDLGALAQVSLANGSALLTRESPAEVLERIANAERSR